MLGLFSCNNRKDIFESSKNMLSLIKTGTTMPLLDLKDSVKGSAAYSCTYSISTGEKLTVKSTYKKGKGVVTITNNTIIVSPADTGLNIIEFSAADKQGNISTADLELIHFINLKPVAVLNIVKNGNSIMFIASGSYDRDAKFGGKITLYNYYIAEIPYYASLTSDTISYSIQIPKSYTVRLSVRDNDNDTAFVIKTLVIP